MLEVDPDPDPDPDSDSKQLQQLLQHQHQAHTDREIETDINSDTYAYPCTDTDICSDTSIVRYRDTVIINTKKGQDYEVIAVTQQCCNTKECSTSAAIAGEVKSDTCAPKNRTMHKEDVNETLKESFASFVCKCCLWLCLLAVTMTLFDVLIFYLHSQKPKINKLEIYLGGFEPAKTFSPIFPTSTEAMVKIYGEAPRSSWTTTLDVSEASCSYYYRQDSGGKYDYAGDINVVLALVENNTKTFVMSLLTQNTDFNVLRRVLWDVNSNLEVRSSIQFECSMTLVVYFFHGVRYAYPSKFSREHNLSEFQDTSAVADSSLGASRKKTGNSHFKFVDPSFSSSDVNTTLVVDHDFHKALHFNGHSIDSVVVHVPQISFATTLVNLEASSERSQLFELRSGAISLDLADPLTPFLVHLHIGCVQEPQVNAEKCLLLDSFNLNRFKKYLVQHKFVNITAQALENNFLVALVGNHHHIRTIDQSFAHKLFTRLNEARSLSTSVVNCIALDCDGIYVSELCSKHENGLWKLLIHTYSNAEVGREALVNVESVWSRQGFKTNLEGTLTTKGKENKLFGNIGIQFDDCAYRGNLVAINKDDDTVEAHWSGKYGGAWEDWWFDVDQFAISYHDSLVLSMFGKMLVQVPLSLNDILLGVQFAMFDTAGPIASSNFTFLNFYTDDNWSASGNVILSSVYSILDADNQLSNWNTSVAVLYGGNIYTIYATENPTLTIIRDTPRELFMLQAPEQLLMRRQNVSLLTSRTLLLSATNDDDVVMQDRFALVIAGTYGWHKHLNGYLTIDASILVIDSSVVGQATGRMLFTTPTINTGNLGLGVTLLNSNKEVVVQNKVELLWQTDSNWKDSCYVVVKTEFAKRNSPLTWNITAFLDYREHQFKIWATENVESKAPNVMLWGTGEYIDNADHWLADSKWMFRGLQLSCVIEFISSRTVRSYCTIVDSSNVTQLLVDNFVLWHNLNRTIQIASQAVHRGVLIWNMSGVVDYDDTAYSASIIQRLGFDDFSLRANGTYGRNSSHWWMVVHHSDIAVDNTVIGHFSGLVNNIDSNSKSVAIVAVVSDSIGTSVFNASQVFYVVGTSHNASFGTYGHFEVSNILSRDSDFFVALNSTMHDSGASLLLETRKKSRLLGNSESNQTTGNIRTLFSTRYWFNSPENIYFSIDDALIVIDQVPLLDMKMLIASNTTSSGQTGRILFNASHCEGSIDTLDQCLFADSSLGLASSIRWESATDVQRLHISTNSVVQSQQWIATENYYCRLGSNQTLLSHENIGGEDGLDMLMQLGWNTNSVNSIDMHGIVRYEGNMLFSVDGDGIQHVASVSPTRQPTTLPTEIVNTFSPTSIIPSKVPTVSPTVPPAGTPYPTVLPTKAQRVKFVVSQTFIGIDYETFVHNEAANIEAVKATVVQCMTGVTLGDIADMTVIIPSRRRLRRSKVEIMSSVTISYLVSLASSPVPYSNLIAELSDNIASGKFALYLAENSADVGADLGSVTTSSIDATNLISSNETSTHENTWIIFVAVGASIVVLMIGAALGYVKYKRSIAAEINKQSSPPAQTLDFQYQMVVRIPASNEARL